MAVLLDEGVCLVDLHALEEFFGVAKRLETKELDVGKGQCNCSVGIPFSIMTQWDVLGPAPFLPSVP